MEKISEISNELRQHDSIRQDQHSDLIGSVVDEIGRGKNNVIPILQKLQAEIGYLPAEALKHVCEITDISPAQISGVVTFYSQFRHLPAGKHTIKICTGTACHVKGASLVAAAFKRELSIKAGESVTADRLFSVEAVSCLGCCTLAPVVQIDQKTYGHMKTAEVQNIVQDFLRSEKEPTEAGIILSDSHSGAEIRVGVGSCCVAGGSQDILYEVEKTVKDFNIAARIKTVGCVGVCNQTPLLEIAGDNRQPIRYTKVETERVNEIILRHLHPEDGKNKLRKKLIDWLDTFHTDKLLLSPTNLEKTKREAPLTNFLKYQTHIATENYGEISPFSLDEYLSNKGFKAFKTALIQNRNELINLMIRSELRGRGGGGFPAGEKWRLAFQTRGDKKYIIGNGDEGDPGAFMDRMLLESFPFRIIEGMLIAAYAVGADEGIFYIRAEYPLAVERIKNAVKLCEDEGFIGDNILGSDFSFTISVFEGAGAFICGEETALINSIQGERGNPNDRPPFPVEKGLYDYPTLVHNTETLGVIPWIVRNGPEAFRSIGTESGKGTKVFALAGKVSKGGLIEVPMGISVRDVVEKIGGGVAEGRTFKAVQIGGPSGGCIPERLADTPIDYENLTRLGAMMGSGGLVVLDNTDCMVDIARYFLAFTHDQSCGKCTFCRVGTTRMLRILDKFSQGKGKIEEIGELEKLCLSVQKGSICALGKTAPNPVLTSIQYFRSEYEAHTKGVCPAGKCADLIQFRINDKCNGCTKCVAVCPVDAIEFRPYEIHEVKEENCVKCGACLDICPVDAIEK